MKPDFYKTKASREWKRKHKKTQENILSTGTDIISSGSDESDSENLNSLDHKDSDADLLLQLQNKIVGFQEKQEQDLNNSLKISFVGISGNHIRENIREKDVYKGFHDQIFSQKKILLGNGYFKSQDSCKLSENMGSDILKVCKVDSVERNLEKNVEVIGSQKSIDLQEWLDDLLG